MSRIVRIFCILAVLCLAVPPAVAGAAAPQLPPNCKFMNVGHETRVVCIPLFFWNHDLVVFAHGYEFDDGVSAPKLGEEQWLIQLANGKTITLPELVNVLGFGFAATSYSKNGLAVREGVAEMKTLVADVRAKYPGVRNVYIVGASEGGLITTLSMERNADIYKGGLALCGPIGDFQKQINYWGDFRAAYDALFPGTMNLTPIDDAVTISPTLMLDWANSESLTRTKIIAQLSDNANGVKIATLLGATGAQIDPLVPTTLGDTTLGILTYNVFATNEARLELSKGLLPIVVQPYDNLDNLALKAIGAQPYAALPNRDVVSAALLPYQTTGMLTKPLVTLHTVGDPIVPVWHETLYATKVAMAKASSKLTVLPVNRYGHCIFKPAEVLFGFAMMLYQSNRLPIKMAQYQTVLDAADPGAGAFTEFEALNAQFGDLSQTQIFLPVVTGQH